MFGAYERLRNKLKAYINLKQMKEISKYNIIKPKQRMKKGEKLELSMKHLNDSWVKMIYKGRYIFKKKTHINESLLLEWM